MKKHLLLTLLLSCPFFAAQAESKKADISTLKKIILAVVENAEKGTITQNDLRNGCKETQKLVNIACEKAQKDINKLDQEKIDAFMTMLGQEAERRTGGDLFERASNIIQVKAGLQKIEDELNKTEEELSN